MLLLTLCALTLSPVALQEQATAPAADAVTLPQDLSVELERIRAKYDLPAMAAITINSAGLVTESYAGTHTMDGDVLVTSTAKFHLGSCTKAMTATLAATFVEAGELEWDSTLAQTFPKLKRKMHKDWRDVTLAQLLSHTAGAPTSLKDWAPLAKKVNLGKGKQTALRLDVVRTLTESAPQFAPGSSYQYSNWGYVIAGAMLEEISGDSWESLMRTRIFEPLDMNSCGFGAPNPKRGSGQPSGHTGDGRSVPGTDNPATIGPAGTVHGTLQDWAKFVQLHLRGARGDEDLLLKPETFQQLHAVQPGTNGTYGGGWITTTRSWSKGPILTHSGSNTVWFCTTWIAAEEDFAVLVAGNRGGDTAAKGVDQACAALIRHQAAQSKPPSED